MITWELARDWKHKLKKEGFPDQAAAVGALMRMALPQQEIKALALIRKSPGISTGDLSRQLGIENNATWMLCQRLEWCELVSKDDTRHALRWTAL